MVCELASQMSPYYKINCLYCSELLQFVETSCDYMYEWLCILLLGIYNESRTFHTQTNIIIENFMYFCIYCYVYTFCNLVFAICMNQ